MIETKLYNKLPKKVQPLVKHLKKDVLHGGYEIKLIGGYGFNTWDEKPYNNAMYYRGTWVDVMTMFRHDIVRIEGTEVEDEVYKPASQVLEEKASWGGARKGAGRPKGERKQICLWVTEEERAVIKKLLKDMRK